MTKTQNGDNLVSECRHRETFKASMCWSFYYGRVAYSLEADFGCFLHPWARRIREQSSPLWHSFQLKGEHNVMHSSCQCNLLPFLNMQEGGVNFADGLKTVLYVPL